MRDLDPVRDAVLARLADKHHAREVTLTASRRATRAAANAIRAAHRGERDSAERLLAEAESALREARSGCAAHPDVEHAGFLHDAQKEYAEARITLALVAGEELPTPENVGVPDVGWLHGVAEAVGELRRHLLDVLRTGRLERCEELLTLMEDLYGLLVTVDFPEGLTAGLRRSTDVARAIIERTRGDVTTSLVQARLQAALERHAARLE